MAFSKIHEILPQDFGYVVLAGAGSLLVNLWHMKNVGQGRKKYEVPYPAMYSNDSEEFNCIQRSHQNYLENLSQFLFLVTTSGLQYPRVSAAAGGLWLVGRVMYTRGYTSGEPKKRMPGGMIAHLAEVVLLGGAVSFACHLIGCFGKP